MGGDARGVGTDRLLAAIFLVDEDRLQHFEKEFPD